jgi:hypothetical protein
MRLGRKRVHPKVRKALGIWGLPAGFVAMRAVETTAAH